METISNIIGFEYNREKRELLSPFETFLKYTNEKEKSSVVLKNILNKLVSEEKMSILDIGSGDGTYIRLTLKKIRIPKGTKITLLEPSKYLAKKLRMELKYLPKELLTELSNQTFDHFNKKALFDIVIASHLPISKELLPQTLSRMLGFLKAGGHLIIILRVKDDTYRFRTKFRSRLLNDKKYKSLIINDVFDVLNKLKKDNHLDIKTFKSNSRLHIPIGKNEEDTTSIIEFFLNEKWNNIPPMIQREINAYIKRKKGAFRQTDGFILVTKK